MAQTIAFIGLGNMGGGMAANLVKNGFAVRAFDLSDAALAKAEAAGVSRAQSAAAAGVARQFSAVQSNYRYAGRDHPAGSDAARRFCHHSVAAIHIRHTTACCHRSAFAGAAAGFAPDSADTASRRVRRRQRQARLARIVSG